jgi:hypothetical protein
MTMVKNKNEGKGYLLSRIEVSARLLTRMASVRRTLALYPNLKPVRSGTCLEYVLDDGEARDHFYLVRIESTFATLAIYSKTTPLYFIQEAVLRFLNIIQVIGRDYEVRLPSLYPYLILALSGQQTRRILLEETSVQKENPDILLARRLIQLMKENKRLGEIHTAELGRSRRLLQTLVVIEGSGGAGIEEITKNTGLSKAEILGILPSLHEIGYKAISITSDKFNLVRM